MQRDFRAPGPEAAPHRSAQLMRRRLRSPGAFAPRSSAPGESGANSEGPAWEVDRCRLGGAKTHTRNPKASIERRVPTKRKLKICTNTYLSADLVRSLFHAATTLKGIDVVRCI